MTRAKYAMMCLNEIDFVKIPFLGTPHFCEFIVNFDECGRSVAEINQQLLHQGIFGGVDLSHDFPQLGNSALYCVTELHSGNDIDKLVQSIEEIVSDDR